MRMRSGCRSINVSRNSLANVYASFKALGLINIMSAMRLSQRISSLRFSSSRPTTIFSLAIIATSFAMTGCYTQVAGTDRWGYGGKVERERVVYTEDTVVVRRSTVLREQPVERSVVTDTVRYSTNTDFLDDQPNTVVNNYYGFPSYQRTWYDNYGWYDPTWHQPQVGISVRIGTPYPFGSHRWYNGGYSRSWASPQYYDPYYGWYHGGHRYAGWTYYDPFYPRPGFYGSTGYYGCGPTYYDPYFDYPYTQRWGYNNGGYYGYNNTTDNDARDRSGRERRRGRVGGEDRAGNGSTATPTRGGGSVTAQTPQPAINRTGPVQVNAPTPGRTGRNVEIVTDQPVTDVANRNGTGAMRNSSGSSTPASQPVERRVVISSDDTRRTIGSSGSSEERVVTSRPQRGSSTSAARPISSGASVSAPARSSSSSSSAPARGSSSSSGSSSRGSGSSRSSRR